MGVYAPISTGLTKNHTPAELEPGQAFLVRFKNARRNYRTDLWIGIILTEEFGPGKYLNGRPKKAKQTDGTWSAPLNERIYPVYLPAKNSFRWVNIADIFDLDPEVPTPFTRASGRDDAEIFRHLQRLALKKPPREFWESMAQKELHLKGRKCRNPELVLPDRCQGVPSDSEDLIEDGFLGAPVELDAGPVIASSSGSSLNPALGFSRQVNEAQAAATSNSSMSTPKPYLFEDLDTIPAMRNFTRKLAFPGAAQPSKISPATRQTVESQGAASSGSQSPQVKVEPRSPKGKAPIRPVKKMRKSIYSVTLTEIIGKILHESPEAEELSDIVSAVLEIRQKPEAAKIRSFDTTGEFAPREVQILTQPSTGSPTENTTQTQDTPQLGDISNPHRNYRLEGINDPKTLQDEILALGILYKYARRFNKPSLVKSITNKLQIAWNSYPGLCQLDPILDVTVIAFQDGFVLEKVDVLQEWILKFIADTRDLFPVACNNKYWKVMTRFPALVDAINERRDKLAGENPKKYSDVRVLLRERGVPHL